MSKLGRSALLRHIPNLITVARIVLAPVVVAAIADRQWPTALGGFALAGVSDAVDGWLAKRFNLRSELGAYLDPLADKALLVSIYAALAWVHSVPVWLAIMIVFRDLMIVGAVIISWLMGNPVRIHPLRVSKANTALQIVFAGLVLAARSFDFGLSPWAPPLAVLVAALTLASLAAYLLQWLKHMSG